MNELTESLPQSIFFRFPDEATGMDALEAAGFTTTDEDGNVTVVTASHTHAIDVVGAISIGGTYDPKTGNVITPPTLLNGWHVNYVGEMPKGWEQYGVTPEQPVRVFAS